MGGTTSQPSTVAEPTCRKICAAGGNEVRVAATELLRVAGLAAYHTSLLFDGHEYFFDGHGIVKAAPLWSHLVGSASRPPDLRTEVFTVGHCSMTGDELLQGLRPFFDVGSYDVLFKNCNSFTDAAVYFLTRLRLDARFSRVERLLVATAPVSLMLLNELLRASCPGIPRCGRLGPYVSNPLAQGFSVEQVVAACDASDSHCITERRVRRLRTSATCGLVDDCCAYAGGTVVEDMPGLHGLHGLHGLPRISRAAHQTFVAMEEETAGRSPGHASVVRSYSERWQPAAPSGLDSKPLSRPCTVSDRLGPPCRVVEAPSRAPRWDSAPVAAPRSQQW